METDGEYIPPPPPPEEEEEEETEVLSTPTASSSFKMGDIVSQ